jgi:hypothetical protein
MAVAAAAAGLIAEFCAQTDEVVTCHDVDGEPSIGEFDLCLNESGYSKALAGIPVVFKAKKDLHKHQHTVPGAAPAATGVNWHKGLRRSAGKDGSEKSGFFGMSSEVVYMTEDEDIGWLWREAPLPPFPPGAVPAGGHARQIAVGQEVLRDMLTGMMEQRRKMAKRQTTSFATLRENKRFAFDNWSKLLNDATATPAQVSAAESLAFATEKHEIHRGANAANLVVFGATEIHVYEEEAAISGTDLCTVDN